MKRCCLLLLALAACLAASAQNHPRNILGVRAGLNVASYTLSSRGESISTDSRAGFHIGVSDQMLMSARLPLYFETGLSLSSRGGKDDGASLRPLYLQIPVLVNYHIGTRNIVEIQPFAGIYYGVGIGGKAKADGEKEDIFGDGSTLKRSDLGVRLGAGVTWRRFYFGLGYDIGCLNLLKNDIDGAGVASIRNSSFTLTVGYNF